MKGEMSPVMTAAILTGLRIKKETIGEIAAAAPVMRELAPRSRSAQPRTSSISSAPAAMRAHTFNISTASAFVAAAAGAHGGQARQPRVSSKSGSADVLEALGANIDLQPAQVAECIEEVGMGFMFAPNHHPAMKNVAPVRTEMGVRTIFNILGPLTNPASAPNTLMGVFHPDLVGIQVRVMQRLGAAHVLVVWGKDGMDEISLGAATMVGELQGRRDPRVRNPSRGLRPADGLQPQPEGRRRRGVEGHAARGAGEQAGTPREIVVLNAGTALYTANLAPRSATASLKAREAIASGAAREGRRVRRIHPAIRASTQAERACHAIDNDASRRHRAKKILAVKARGGDRAQARPHRSPSSRRSRRSAAAPRLRRRAAGENRGNGTAGGDRRNQEGQPVQGRAARDFRPAGSPPATSSMAPPACRCSPTASSSRAPPSTCKPRAPPARCPACARTSWSIPIRSTEPGPGRRRHPADRRRADDGADAGTGGIAPHAFGMAVLVEAHDGAEVDRALQLQDAADRHQQPQPAHFRGHSRDHARPARPDSGRPHRRHRNRHPRRGGRRADAQRGVTPSWSAKPSCARRIPGAALAALFGGTARRPERAFVAIMRCRAAQAYSHDVAHRRAILFVVPAKAGSDAAVHRVPSNS